MIELKLMSGDVSVSVLLLKLSERKDMKRSVIAVFLSISLLAGSFSAAPAYAAEATSQETESEQDVTSVSEEDDTSAAGEENETSGQDLSDQEAAIEEAGNAATVEEAGNAATVEEAGIEAANEEAGSAATVEEAGSAATVEEAGIEAANEEAGNATTSEAMGVDTEIAAVVEPTTETTTGKEAMLAGEVGDVVESGTCGENVTWTVTCTGVEGEGPFTLTISGSGEMYDYYANSSSYLIQSVSRPGTEIHSAPPWYAYCFHIDTVIVEEGITYIGKNAFSDMTSLTSITLPDSLISVGEAAFSGCGIINITLPSGVTEIGLDAFADCTELEFISIPDGVTVIPEGLFFMCSALSSISLPKNLTAINEAAFGNCTSLTEITIPNSVITIGDGAFIGCSSLTELTLPDNLTTINESVLGGCSSLTNITIPDSVVTINKEAFAYCSSLTSVEFPAGLESIGPMAFQDCTSLEDIIVLGKNTETSEDTFYNDEQLLWCYTYHGAYIADHVPTYNGTDSVTTIIYLDGEEEKGEFSFVTDKVIAQVGDEIDLWNYVNGWNPQSEQDYYYEVEISNKEDFSLSFEVITCNGVGETDITMEYGGKTASMKVICVDGDIPAAESVAFKESELTVTKGTSFYNPFVLVPENSKTDCYSPIAFITDELCPGGWDIETSDPNVASYDGISFYAEGAGTATLSLVDYGTGDTITEFEVTVEEPSCALLVKGTEMEIEKGTTETLIVKKYPADNSDPIYFESSDNSVVEVSETGEITAKDFGFAKVIVRCGNVSRIVKITVPCPATGISLPDKVTLRYNQGTELIAALTPSNSTDRDVVWETDNEDVLYMYSWKDHCEIGGQGIGTALLTASINGHTAATVVTVLKAIPDIDKVDPIEAKCGQSLSELRLPYNMEWQDPDQSVGSAGEHGFAANYVPEDTEHYETVYDIMVTVNVSHDFVQEWTASDGTHWHKCKCGEITDDNGNIWVPASSISLDKDEMTLYTGMDDMLEATVLPENASDKGVEWTTSDENVVKVDEFGTVFAAGAGDAVITATTADGSLTAQCAVHVLREPEIVQNPSDVEALIGENVEFSVVAEGNSLKYQWQWSSDGITWKNCTNTSYNTDTFHFVMKDKYAGRWYRCIVTTDDRRLISEAAFLSLKESDEIIAHPDDVDAEEGETVAFIVEFSGDHPTYQWQWSSDGVLWRNCTGTGYNQDTFTFVMREKYAGRMYRCKVTEDGDIYISDAALLSLIQVSEILSQPDNAEVSIGDTVSFIVEFSGDDPEYQWQWSADGIAWRNCTSESYNSNTFSFVMQEKFAGRMYRCVISAGGETYISDSALLTMNTDTRITKQPDDVTVAAGNTAVFHIEASGSGLTYQWQWSTDGSTWKNCTSNGYKTDTLSFKAQTKYNGRRYRCRVTSGDDKVYSEFGVLTVTE